MKKAKFTVIIALLIFVSCNKDKDEDISSLSVDPPVDFFGLKTTYTSTDQITYHTETIFGRLKTDKTFQDIGTVGADILQCAYNISACYDYANQMYYVYLTNDDIGGPITTQKLYAINAATGTTTNTFSINLKGNLVNLKYNGTNNKLYCIVLDTVYFGTPTSSVPSTDFYLAEINTATGTVTAASPTYTCTDYASGVEGMCIDEQNSKIYITYPENLPLAKSLKVVTIDLNSNTQTDSKTIALPDNYLHYNIIGFNNQNSKIYITCINDNDGYLSIYKIDDLTMTKVIARSSGAFKSTYGKNSSNIFGFANNTCYPSTGYYTYTPNPFVITWHDLVNGMDHKIEYPLADKTMYFGLVPVE